MLPRGRGERGATGGLGRGGRNQGGTGGVTGLVVAGSCGTAQDLGSPVAAHGPSCAQPPLKPLQLPSPTSAQGLPSRPRPPLLPLLGGALRLARLSPHPCLRPHVVASSPLGPCHHVTFYSLRVLAFSYQVTVSGSAQLEDLCKGHIHGVWVLGLEFIFLEATVRSTA